MEKEKGHQRHSSLVKRSWNASTPELKGLVLAGGQSSRMGEDKTILSYHGMPQRDYMLQLLHRFVPDVFLSCHPDRVPQIDYRVIPDSFLDLGPYGGVLSAFRQDPNSAWLVVASDQPLLDEEMIALLVNQRDASKMATCFYNPETEKPEPLITIFEPKAYPALLEYLSEGTSCLRKALIRSECKVIQIDRPEVLRNANTPEEVIEMRKILGIPAV